MLSGLQRRLKRKSVHESEKESVIESVHESETESVIESVRENKKEVWHQGARRTPLLQVQRARSHIQVHIPHDASTEMETGPTVAIACMSES